MCYIISAPRGEEISCKMCEQIQYAEISVRNQSARLFLSILYNDPISVLAPIAMGIFPHTNNSGQIHSLNYKRHFLFVS
jgi:hypothetical protein